MDLKDTRRVLDDFDDAIVYTIAKRMGYVTDVAEYKKSNGVAQLQQGREKEVIERARGLASREGMDPDLAEEVMRSIIKYAHKIEAKTLGGVVDAQR